MSFVFQLDAFQNDAFQTAEPMPDVFKAGRKRYGSQFGIRDTGRDYDKPNQWDGSKFGKSQRS